MAFTLSGTTITQTGTDTDLSGLSAIAGVTTITIAGKTFYSLGANRLVINGVLTGNPKTEQVITDFDPQNGVSAIRVNGTLEVKNSEDINGDILYNKDVLFKTTSVDTFCCDRHGFHVSNTGTLIMNGGIVVDTASTTLVDEGSRIEIKNGGIVQPQSTQIRWSCTDYDIDGFYLYKAAFVVLVEPQTSSVLKGLQLIEEGHQLSGVFPAGVEYVISDYETTGVNIHLGIADNNYNTLLNPVDGVIYQYRGLIIDTRAIGLARIKNRIQFKTTKQDGTEIENTKVFSRDYNNGERRDWAAGSQGGDSYSAINFTDDRVYEETTDVAGLTPEFDVLTEVVARPTGSVGDLANQGLNTVDYRHKSGVPGESAFDFYLIHYNYDISQIEKSVMGVGNKIYNQVLFLDTSITEEDPVVVGGYTELGTPDKLYDYAKLHLLDNYEGETNPIVNRVGDAIDAGAYDVEFSSGGANVFDFDGTTIFVKCGTLFTGDIETTGTVTFTGSATINGGIIDTNGDSYINFIEALSDSDTWKVFDVEANRDSNTGEIGSGDGTENFRFLFTGATTYYLRIIRVSSGAIMPINLSISEAGNNQFSFDLLASIQSAITLIESLKQPKIEFN